MNEHKLIYGDLIHKGLSGACIEKKDNVNQPAHYQGKIECIDAIEAAVEALENIHKWLPTIGQKGLRDYEYDALEVCKKILNQSEKDMTISDKNKIKSDGSTASYYGLPKNCTELQDLISNKNMNAQIGEIFRECYRYGQASHCDELRGIKKILFYANAELKRLEK